MPPAEGVAARVTVQRSEMRRRTPAGALLEVVVTEADGSRRHVRPGDAEWASYLATEDTTMVHRVKVSMDGFDGQKHFNPGDTVTVDTEFAQRLVARGHGELLDDAEEPLALVDACRALRMTDPGHASLAAGCRSKDAQAALVAAIAEARRPAAPTPPAA